MKNKSEYDNHQVWVLVDDLLECESLPELPSDTREYLLYLLNDLKKRRGLTNPFYLDRRRLDDMRNRLSNIRSYIPHNTRSIDSSVADCFNDLASHWPAHNGRQVADIQKETYDSFINDAAQQIEVSRNRADQVVSIKEAVQTEADKARHSLDSLVKEADESLAQIERDAEERTEQLSSKLEQAIANSASRADDSFASIESDYVESMKGLESEAAQLLEKVRTRSSSISGWVIAESYGKYARNKTFSFFVYDLLAVIFAVAGIGLVAFALAGLNADETSAVVFKFAVSVASFTISGFLFRRGTFNQNEAKAAKRTELTLRQYEPFIANLSEEDKKRITRDIAERIFVKGEIDEKAPGLLESMGKRQMSDEQLSTLLELAKIISKEV